MTLIYIPGSSQITNSRQCSWYEFAKTIFELMGMKPDFGPTTTAAYGARARQLAYSVLAVGDASFVEKSRARMNKFKEQGRTILLVTHDLATVEGWCHQALWLDHGYVQALGDPKDVVARYRMEALAVVS